MTPQEQQLLQGLTDRINQTVLPDKDPEAEFFLTQTLGRNPDALYILAQTVLVQQYALDQAKQQLAARQQPAPPPVKHTNFLGSLLGTDEPKQPPPPPPQQYSQQPYAPVPNYPAPNYPPPLAYAQPQYMGSPAFGAPPLGGFGAPVGGSGFLGSALRTAGTVAAGAIAFEGIEHLMHGFGEHAGYGSGSGFGNFGGNSGQPREEIVNNYYGDTAGHEHEAHPGVSNDIEDRRGIADTTSVDDASDDSDYTNDGSTDDDSSTFDDSGSDFGGSDDSN